MIKLREYQIRALNQLYDARREGYTRICWVLPGGSGKSTITAHLGKRLIERGKTMNFIVHSEELVFQFRDRVWDQFGIKAGIIMGDHPEDRKLPIQVSSVLTLINRELPDVDVVVIDEAHRAKAKSYQKIIDQLPDASIIGLTATPFRADGSGLGGIFQKIVHPVKVSELIDKGYLVPTLAIGPKESADMSDVDDVGGEYNKGQMYEKFKNTSLVKGVVENYKKYAKGKKALVFNVNRKHAKQLHEKFLDQDIKSVYVDGETPKTERRKIVKEFARGEVPVLNSIDIFTEGFDIPDTEVIILNRATKSFGLYCQMVKRGMRPAKGKKRCIVIDHGMNTERFGYVDDYDAISFSLKGVKKKGKKSDDEDKARRCPECNVILKAGENECPNCSYTFPEREDNRRQKSVESKGFVVYDRQKSILKRIQKLKHKELKKIPLEYLRITEIIRGYSRGWFFHQAIDRGLVDVDKEDNDSWQKVSALCKRAEIKKGTYKLHRMLVEQKRKLKEADNYTRNPKIISM